ncbi:hypothetical protein AQPE_2294 [Aquipluma nitroreducens]|uniref:Uncharacterized protein n=1 Tax=Aquipluma nitroreducens TaxID=2010828 RepID=A0A5K7SA22_9BACT|nr:hypothetical protein AQPE_2294 [Aquipluma nitroreducens]
MHDSQVPFASLPATGLSDSNLSIYKNRNNGNVSDKKGYEGRFRPLMMTELLIYED